MTTVNIDALKDAIEIHLGHHSPEPETLRTLLKIWGNDRLADAAADALARYQSKEQHADHLATELNWHVRRALAGEAVPQEIQDALTRASELLEEFFTVSRRVRIEIGRYTEDYYEGAPVYQLRG